MTMSFELPEHVADGYRVEPSASNDEMATDCGVPTVSDRINPDFINRMTPGKESIHVAKNL
jgi:hypothetical protein